MKFKIRKSYLIIPILLAAFAMGVSLGYLQGHSSKMEDYRFEKYTEDIFRQEVNNNTLSLHYTLAHPEKYGIAARPVTLGSISLNDEESYLALENYEAALRKFDYKKLSEDNRITLDTLLLYFHTLQESASYELFQEVLGPSLGIQAQLPVLLAEYPFYNTNDIEDYLSLLSEIKSYFQEILTFETAKSQAGYFMNDTSLERVLSQCEEFIANPDTNYLQEIFEDKIEDMEKISEANQNTYIERHRTAIIEDVIPAYELLIEGLTPLKGTCQNPDGLCHFPEGKKYYAYLLKSEVGVYGSVDSIRQRLQNQLMMDYTEMGNLLNENPTLATAALTCEYTLESPQKALDELQQACLADFPPLTDYDYEVKYVHKSMEDFLSPAFYLTPPVDTLSPNIIYINEADHTSDLELYATLGHEGFPGHLYQTLYFNQCDPKLIRYLPSFGGYIEGWATYIEAYAYSYVPEKDDLTRVLWLNRSINLCLYSIVDMGIHYYGWKFPEVSHYLGNFGISDLHTLQSIYQLILESPANYLRYYVGYLNFLDLRTEMQQMQGDSFDPIDFHRQILEIGPTQFPVLRKHLGFTN